MAKRVATRGHVFDQEVAWSIVQTGEALESALRELADQKRYAWDTEGTGLTPYRGSRIIGHSFAWRQDSGRMKAIYLPVRHEGDRLGLSLFDLEKNLDPDLVTSGLKPILEDPAPVKIAHNAKFDIHMAEQDGIRAQGQFRDTVIACKLINENWRSYKLANCLAMSRLPHEPDWKQRMAVEVERVAKLMRQGPSAHQSEHGYKYTSIAMCGRYACQDAAYELRLGEWALPQVESNWPDIWTLECELLWTVLDLERRGVPISATKLRQLSDLAYSEQAQWAPKVFGAAGFEFDLGNDNEVRTALFDRLVLPVNQYTEGGGQPAVNDDVLWKLELGIGVEEHQRALSKAVAAPLRHWRDYQKIKTTYTLGLIELADANGVLHADLDQGGAKTGRVSCRKPNLQNVPIRTELGRRVREAFEAREGMVRYCLDFSQVELRVLAHLTKDSLLLKIYREGLDAHATTAVEAFGTAEKVGGVDMRKIAKILNFGTSFCMTEVGLMSNVNKDLPAGVKWITEAKAKEFQAQFYRRYASIVRYREYLWRVIEASKGHYYENLFKRPRRIEKGFDLHDSRPSRRAAERQSIASMVQGSAADLIKFAMNEVGKYLRSQQDCEAGLVLMVHDDLQIDARVGGSAKMIRECHRIMETAGVEALKRITGKDFAVPVIVDVEYFADPGNWAHKYKMVVR